MRQRKREKRNGKDQEMRVNAMLRFLSGGWKRRRKPRVMMPVPQRRCGLWWFRLLLRGMVTRLNRPK